MGWERGLPTDAIIGLTYFEDLKNPTKPSLQRRKGELVHAVNAVMGSAGSLKPGSETINSALEFLLSIAQSEQAKELAIIEDYKKRLKDTLPENKELDELINSLTLENASKDKDFYIKLTKAINMIRQGTENFKNRLNRFEQHQGKSISELYKDDYNYRFTSDLQTTINSIIGTGSAHEADSYNERIRKVVFSRLEGLKKNGILDSITSGADFIYLAAAIQADVEAAIQKASNKNSKFSDVANLSQKTIDKIMAEHDNLEEQYQTRVQRALNGDKEELLDILKEGRKFINIKKLKEADEIEAHVNKIHRIKELEIKKNAKRKNKKNNLRTMLEDLGIDEKILSDFDRIEVKTNVDKNGKAIKNIHGVIYEYLSSILRNNSIKIAGSAAVDLVTIECILSIPDAKERVRQLREAISKAYTRYAALTRTLDQDSNRELLNETNAVIRQAEALLNEQLNSLEAPDDIFVYHETLKLYGSMETGKQYSSNGFELGKFHGRNIALLTAITELYSAAGIGAGALPNRTALEMIAYNLAPGALGARYKGDVEYIFSIFAGLLMFGDIQNMALEAAKAIDTGSIKNIHMYLLNDVYVPASMLLMNTYEAASQAVSMLSSDQAATAKIALRGSKGVVDNWLAIRPSPTPEMWESIGDKVGSEIQIQISFMSGFVNFVNSLMKI